MFVVRCPQCKHTMRYQAQKAAPVSEKKKKCVYCGHTFKIHPSLPASRIEREEDAHTTTPLFHSATQKEEFLDKHDKPERKT